MAVIHSLGFVPSSPLRAGLRGTDECVRRYTRLARPHLFNQASGYLFQEARRDTGFWQIGAIAASIDCARQDELIHRAGHADVAEAPLFFDVVGNQHRPGVWKQALFQPA